MARWVAIIFVLAVAIVVAVIQKRSRREYPVPPKGGVVISGASTGIGYDAALTLADAGYVTYAGVRKEADADRLNALGKPTLTPIILDVANQESVDSAYEVVMADAASRGIPVIGIVNNAGIVNVMPVEFESMEEMSNVFNVNVWGAIRLSKAFLPELRAHQGRIIMISSVAGFFVMPRTGTYAASKWAMEAYSDALRMETSRHNVSVSVIQPGAVKSAIFGKVEGKKKQIAEENPQIREVYQHLLKDTTNEIELSAEGPEVTSEAILHALSSPFPKTRYPVARVSGLSAIAIKWLIWLLPDRIRDIMVLRKF